jgi:hypothetical protein
MPQQLIKVNSMKSTRINRRPIPVILGWMGLVAFGITGCGGGAAPTPPLGMAKGKITINGTPAPNLVVTLESTTPGVARSGGVTNALGEFEVSYLGTTPNPKGAPVGKHIVRIASASSGPSKVPGIEGSAVSAGGFGDPADDAPKPDVVVIPDKYNANSDTYVTIAAGDNPALTYDLKIPKK